MKRYLLLVIAFVCVSIGTWAGPAEEGFEMKKEDIGRWYFQNEPTAMDKVIKVEVTKSGGLKAALDELNLILRGSNQKPHFAEFRAKLDETGVIQDDVNGPHTFNDFIAKNSLILKVVYKKEGNAPETLTLSAEDITALNAINITTIDLQDLKPADVFTLDNDNVKNLILPDGWTKAQVEAAASACGSLNAAMSLVNKSVRMWGDNAYSTVDAIAIMAYVKTPGTLYESVSRLGYEGNVNTKVGANGVGPYNFDLDYVKIAEIAGNVSARDYAGGSAKINFAENGHLEFDADADENNSAYNAAVGGGFRSLVGTSQYGALHSASLVELDLGDAIIAEAHNADLTLSMVGSLGSSTEKVVLPTYSGLKTIPADCMNFNSRVRDICIPGNFEYIKTRAFNSNGNNSRIAYIWTTGSDGTVKYDNGAVFTAGGDFICHDEEGYVPNSCLYGTFTLPPNLKLIERFAFGSSINVHDVYVLNPIAPECHVDAFSTDMYVGNNTYNASSIVDGIITRDAYIQGDASSHRFIAMLHYPRETGTPNSQRYTDPSREYSVATGERDGNGNMIYYPNQSEFVNAYLQGSYGYVWKGWDDTRNWFNNELTLGYGSDFKLDSPAHSAIAADGQSLANDLWDSNTSTRLTDGHLEKYDRTFYDLTLGENNQPNEVSAPSTDPTELKPYYEVDRRGVLLYPKAKYEESNYVYVLDEDGDYVKDPSSSCTTVFRAYAGSADDQLERYSRKQVPQTDGQGNIIYEICEDGKYVQDYEWVEDSNGDYVIENVVNGYSITQTLVDGVDTYYSDEEGTVATLVVGPGMYKACGTEDDYSQINTNNEQPGDRAVYYTLSNGEYTTITSLPFSGNPQLWVNTGRTRPKYVATSKLQYGVTHYYDANGVEVVPALTPSNPASGLIYYKDENNVEYETTVFVPGQGNYYIKTKNSWNDDYTLIGDVNNNYPAVDLDGTYYYLDGEEPIYEEATNYTPGTTYYYNNNGTFGVQETIAWYMIAGGGQDLYYISGSHPVYCSAQGEDYDDNETYYSDQNGTTVATTITLNGDYYIPTYAQVYREKTTGDEAPFYRKNYLGTYHLATAADAGETDYYCTVPVDYVSSTPITYSISHDYRGWHQFVLVAVAHNSTEEFEPLRSFITDNDWWTICAPYDLTYSDMIRFFGTDNGIGTPKIPYLSKLMYVIRDVEHQSITLMFSKNLMEYKEQRLDKDTQEGSVTADRVHGYIDDETTWPEQDEQGRAIGTEGYDPIILHAGVPYLIRPNLFVNEQTGNIEATRQFDIFKRDNSELYERLQEAQKLTGTLQKDLIYNGMYTVPAYVVGTSSTVTEGTTTSKTLKMEDGSQFTYTSGTINYRGQEVPYRISTDFTYTFVGTFYNSVMPQYCYFLGWDSQKQKAAFWYSRVQDTSGWNWNNETGVICPNFNTSLRIHAATSLKDPARWVLAENENQQTNIKCDDFTVGAQASNAKQYTMGYGADMNLASVDEDPLAENFGDQEVLSIDEIQSLDVKGEWYNVNGQKLSGRPTQSGVYIMGNKKYVVK